MENIKTMKTKLILLFLLTYSFSFSQGYFKWDFQDRAIVGQHKRMVYRKWGDWYPEPEYRGIWKWKVQTNIAASAVWGYNYLGVIHFSNETNKRYKEGKDIRPLKATGLQNQRYGERVLEKEATENIKKEAKKLQEKSLRDLAHWTGLTASADPLWLLYYKKMLKPLKNFPAQPKNYREWKLPYGRPFYALRKNGVLAKLQEELDILKENYKVARTANMPRGKRILLYHKTLMGWRKFERDIQYYGKTAYRSVKRRSYIIKKDIIKKNTHKALNNKKYGNYEELVEDVITTYNNIK